MQYKVFLLFFVTLYAGIHTYAQTQQSIAKTPEAAVKDSSSAGKTNVGNSLLAAKPLYSSVPLAGEKAYFGEKNDFVNDYTRKYLVAHNQTLNHVQNASATPFSVIDTVLSKKKLPKELKYLAVIESALNHKAVSKAGAVGPWQLMESTAKMMGLTVNRRNDDRTDWYKSTAAATKYLELLYSQLDDWLLVIAAYNSGPTPVQRAIERTGSHNFWDIKEQLPRETQGHVLAFIATASIFENLSKFIDLGSIPIDFKFGKEEEPGAKTATTGALATVAPPAKPGALTAEKKAQFTDEELKNMIMVRIKEPIHFGLMQQELGIDKHMMARWNNDYDQFIYKKYPTPYYNLRVPKDKLDLFLSKKDMLTTRSNAIYSQMLK
jgi:membrane-bound lytic murein transglycosylase D